MYLFILVKSTKSYFFDIFPQGSRSNCAIWKCSTRLILVNFLFLKSTENFLQRSANLNFVAICGGFSPFWPQIDWTIHRTYRICHSLEWHIWRLGWHISHVCQSTELCHLATRVNARVEWPILSTTPRFHPSNTAPRRETWIWIWTNYY